MPVQLPNDTSRDDIDLSKLNSFRKVTRAFILPFIESSVNRTKQDIELPYCCRTTDVVVRQKQRNPCSERIESLGGCESVQTKSKILELHCDILHFGGHCAKECLTKPSTLK